MTVGAEKQASDAAWEFRARHHLGVQPLGDLVELIERTTCADVAVLDPDDGEHGLTMRDPVGGAVFIGIARSRNPMRQRSTLAHELGHLIFEDWANETEYGARSPEEIRADAFARHLLIPVVGVREFLGEGRPATETDLSALVQRFRVSPQIAAIALYDGGHIDEDTKATWMRCSTPQLATRHGWSDHYASLQDDSDRLRAPQSLVARAVTGYAEGVVTAQTLATLRGVPLETMLAELEAAGVRPSQLEPADTEELPDLDVDLSGLEDEGASS